MFPFLIRSEKLCINETLSKKLYWSVYLGNGNERVYGTVSKSVATGHVSCERLQFKTPTPHSIHSYQERNENSFLLFYKRTVKLSQNIEINISNINSNINPLLFILISISIEMIWMIEMMLFNILVDFILNISYALN